MNMPSSTQQKCHTKTTTGSSRLASYLKSTTLLTVLSLGVAPAGIAVGTEANVSAASSYKPLKRTFETLKGRKFECVIWGLRESEIGLSLPSGESFWVAIKNVSPADRDWIDLRRPQIVEYLAKSPKVFLAKFQGVNSNVTTEALQSRLAEDWAGELNRADNKFLEIAKLTGINSGDSAVVKRWFDQLREGLKYDQNSNDIIWTVPTSASFVGSESAKQIYYQLVLGTLLQKIGVSDIDQWRTHVKIEFVEAKAVDHGRNDKPEQNTYSKNLVMPAGELSVTQCGCYGSIIETPACDETHSLTQSNLFSSTSYDPCAPLFECDEAKNRCRILGRRR